MFSGLRSYNMGCPLTEEKLANALLLLRFELWLADKGHGYLIVYKTGTWCPPTELTILTMDRQMVSLDYDLPCNMDSGERGEMRECGTCKKHLRDINIVDSMIINPFLGLGRQLRG